MPLDIRISVDDRDAQLLLENMSDRMKDFKPVFKWAKRELGLMNGNNFATNGLPVGGWEPLSPKYSQWKAENYPGRPLMVASRRLFNSLRNLNGPENKINDTTAEFGTSVEYAKFHQYGTTRMPKRKLVYEPAGFSQMLAVLCARHVVEGRIGVAAGQLLPDAS